MFDFHLFIISMFVFNVIWKMSTDESCSQIVASYYF